MTARRYLPAHYVFRSLLRAGAALAAWCAGFETTAQILAVLAAMSLVGPIELTIAKDAVAAMKRIRR
jgi:hypothetical protein